jgi:hypothetical protein
VVEYLPEGEKGAAGVIEDPIENDSDALCVRLVHQFVKVLQRSQTVVQPKEVRSVVAMVAACLEDRVEVDGRDSQIVQVVEPLADALQVSALEPGERRRRSPRFDVGGVIRRIAVGEPIRKIW